MRNQKDLFVLDGRYIECQSLFELRQGVTDEEWVQIVKETVEFYCFMKAAEELGPTKMDKCDARICRRLRRSIELFKRIDPVEMATFDIDNISSEHTKKLKQQVESVGQTINIAKSKSRKNADIYISGI